MADPKQKSLELPSYLTRHVSPWTAPGWMEAERWRNVVRNQPVAALCEESLIRDIEASDWEIMAKEPKEEDKLAEHIDYYTDVLNPEVPGGLHGFDYWASLMLQDLLELPIGANCEIVRWPAGDTGPLDRPHPRGHVHKLVYMDGATLYCTYDNEFPLAQRLRENITTTVHFRRNEFGRIVMRPRAEIRRWGYGMAPPEKIYLAINMLYRGDAYYASLLLDTPEAGLLDLGSMSKDAARDWVTSFRELFTGIDPFKIPILYETDRSAAYIPFNRPPTDLLLDSTTLKYAQVTHAGYGLTLTDTGLGDPNKTLAGSIRDERRSRRSGYGVTKEKFKNFIQNEILPDYLQFNWLEKDEEAKTQRGRSFLLSVQALEKAKSAGFITAEEGQAQLTKEGHLTIEVEPPEEPEPAPQQPPQLPAPNNNQEELERVPPSEGGRGDTTGQAVQRAFIQKHLSGKHDQKKHSKGGISKKSKLSDQEKEAIRQYSGDYFNQINMHLRGEPRIRDEAKELIPQMDKILNKSVIEKDVTVFRGAEWYDQSNMESGDFSDIRGNTWQVGTEFRDKGFISTSLDKAQAEGFGGLVAPVEFEIKIPAGSNGLDISDFSAKPEEKEVLLPRNSKFTVTDVKRTGPEITDVWHVKLELE